MRVIECLKRKISMLLCLVMVLMVLPLSVIAEEVTTPEFAGGTGTESDPYLIATKYQLDNVRNNLDKNFKMIADITFTTSDFQKGGDFYNEYHVGNIASYSMGWKAIGDETEAFTGTFDGNGYTIYGMENYSYPVQSTKNYRYASVFGRIQNGTIKNLTVAGGRIAVNGSRYDYSYAAGIVGVAENSTIINCCNKNEILGGEETGGIVAYCYETTITNCKNEGIVKGYPAGGIAGQLEGTGSTVEFCRNYGEISRESEWATGEVGGIVGATEKGNKAIIRNCNNYGKVYDGCFSGGIIGNCTSSITTIEKCSNFGEVSSCTTDEEDAPSNVTLLMSGQAGGICGWSYWTTIKECFNSGTIIAHRAAGIAGSSYDAVKAVEIIDCYNEGEIIGRALEDPSGYAYAAGICGSGGRISNCYNVGVLTFDTNENLISSAIGRDLKLIENCYAIDTQEYSATNSSTLCSEEQMKQKSTYAGFDFDDVWNISKTVNDGMPYLNGVLVNPDLDSLALKFYSEIPTATIRKGESIKAAVQLENYGQILYGFIFPDNLNFSFEVSDESVFCVRNVKLEENGVSFSITGLSKGTASLTIIEKNTNISYSTIIGVSNGIASYNADALPSYYEFNQEYNGYIDGIYIDSFQKKINGDCYSVTFDAYNCSSLNGAVQVYDANGNITDIKIIDRFDDNNITSLGDTVITSGKLIWDAFEGHIFTYKSDILSKKTSIEVDVPFGGKIEITNNVLYSGACAIYNYTEFVVESLCLFTDVLNTNKEDYKAYSEEVAGSFVEQYLHFLCGDISSQRYAILAESFQKEFLKISEKTISKAGLVETISTFVDNGEEIFSVTEIDFEQTLLSIAENTGIKITEEALLKAMGHLGSVLEGMFHAADYCNYVSFYIALANPSDINALEIQFSDKEGALWNNGVSVSGLANNETQQENYVLRSFIHGEDAIETDIKTSLDIISNEQKYEVRDIYLEKDGEVVQPNREVTVKIPVSEDFNPEKTLVLWAREEGCFTVKPTSIQDGFCEIKTNHFSQYVVIELDDDKFDAVANNNLAFKSASLFLQDNLAINYKVDKALFDTVGYTNPYVVFEIGGKKTEVKSYTVDGDRYVFKFPNIAPNQMNDTIRATLYATYNGVEYASATREYSVAEYCYSMLELYSADEYAELRTLLVDLLHYGAASQTYTGYRTDALVNASLTAAQLQWGTSEEPVLDTVLDTTYKTVENPTAKWKGAGLHLQDSVSMRLRFTAESIEGLSVKIESGTNTWTISSDKFLEEDDVYYVYFTGLDAGQMRQSVYLTIYDGDIPVSNTVCYSIESYAYEKQNSTIAGLPELVKAMMKYGDSAYAYVH